MNKTVIASIVALIAMAVQLIFHIQIPDDIQTQIVAAVFNAIAIGTTIYALVKKHQKEIQQVQDKPTTNFGYIPSPPDHRDYIYGQMVDMSQELPDEFFLPDEAPIDNQKFGTCGGESGRSRIAMELGGLVDVSPDFIYTEAKKIDGFPGVEGTSPKAVMQVLQKVGACERGLFPEITDINNLPVASQEAYDSAAKYKIQSFYKIQTPDEIKHALFTQGPVIMAGLCCDNFIHADGGFVNIPIGGIVGNHLFTARGYSNKKTHTFPDGTTRTGFFYCKNSWGEQWGEGGYFWLAYDYVTQYLADMQRYALQEAWSSVKAFSTPTPQYQTQIEMWIGNQNAIVNGNTVVMEQPPVLLNNYTMVHERFVAESLGATVDWDQTQQKITIRR